MIEEILLKTLSVEELITTRLIEATRRGDWGEVDNTLVPQLRDVNGNNMAQELLKHVADKDPNVRGVVATALASLEISRVKTRNKVITEMANMAKEDTWMFPAGRAAVVLLGHRGHTNQIKKETEIREAIDYFARRAQEHEWATELTENIPELRAILKT